MEGFNEQFQPKTPEQKAHGLYDILPESMQTGYFGLPHDRSEYFLTKEQAGEVPLPCILVTFKNGDVLELHPQDTQNVEREFSQIQQTSTLEPNVERVELLWRG